MRLNILQVKVINGKFDEPCHFRIWDGYDSEGKGLYDPSLDGKVDALTEVNIAIDDQQSLILLVVQRDSRNVTDEQTKVLNKMVADKCFRYNCKVADDKVPTTGAEQKIDLQESVGLGDGKHHDPVPSVPTGFQS